MQYSYKEKQTLGDLTMSRFELASIASRYDTALSRAMLRALGIDAQGRTPGSVTVYRDRYQGIAECMAQRFGVVL